MTTAVNMNMANPPTRTNGTPITGDTLTGEDIQLIRDDWKALGEEKMQRTIIEDMFKYVFANFHHLKPLWAFGRKVTKNEEDLDKNPGFVSHVGLVTNAINTLVASLHNPRALLHTMNELGNRHFFYEAIEPHYDVLQVAFMHSLHSNRPTTRNASMSQALADAWRKAFINAKHGMQNGLREARYQYMACSMTAQEMVTVISLWDKVKEHGLKEAGLSFCNAAMRSYEELVNDCFGAGSEAAVAHRLNENAINKFAADAMMAMNAAVQTYSKEIGFANLPNALAPFANEYYFTEASPILVRRALMEGLVNMMTYAVGEVAMTESVQHTWMKLYRIVEQSIISNIICR